jgi:hypothetical protein
MSEPQTLNIRALSVRELYLVFAKSGAEGVTEEHLREDISAGVPTNADGTVNLIHNTAWLVKHSSV